MINYHFLPLMPKCCFWSLSIVLYCKVSCTRLLICILAIALYEIEDMENNMKYKASLNVFFMNRSFEKDGVDHADYFNKGEYAYQGSY